LAIVHRPPIAPITPITPMAASATSSQRRASASVGASIYCARIRMAHALPLTRIFGRRPSSGSLEPLFPETPQRAVGTSETMSSWGITTHPYHGHFGDVPPMLQSLFTPYFQNLVLIPHTCKFLVFFHPNRPYLCA
jgi:hypothetical protein